MIRTTTTKPETRKASNRRVGTTLGETATQPPEDAKKTVTIPPPKFEVAKFLIRGTAAYVQEKFPEKARHMIQAKHEAGSTAKKGAKREARDFDAEYESAMHRDEKGRHGIPAPAFRNAMIDACRLVNFKMTHGKQAVFALADFTDATDDTPLVAITKGKPHRTILPVRNTTGVCDLRARPMWDAGWEALVRIRYDADLFTLSDVANLLMRAGIQIGVGAGRPFSKESNGIGWGTFELVE